ncbi:hypothetical protein BZL29_1107 [Mycobacterium kansasii]|uniref:Uncharacterized protein n=1 Tax=Mycobacterium kansasii TaxID=1768 RepID=A0A1V3XX17_MYCKA|nr:hypothetical protein BZL29_1107 [Mycobacterium kansasii]
MNANYQALELISGLHASPWAASQVCGGIVTWCQRTSGVTVVNGVGQVGVRGNGGCLRRDGTCRL